MWYVFTAQCSASSCINITLLHYCILVQFVITSSLLISLKLNNDNYYIVDKYIYIKDFVFLHMFLGKYIFDSTKGGIFCIK